MFIPNLKNRNHHKNRLHGPSNHPNIICEAPLGANVFRHYLHVTHPYVTHPYVTHLYVTHPSFEEDATFPLLFSNVFSRTRASSSEPVARHPSAGGQARESENSSESQNVGMYHGLVTMFLGGREEEVVIPY